MKNSTIVLIITLGATFGGFCIAGGIHLAQMLVAAKIFSVI